MNKAILATLLCVSTVVFGTLFIFGASSDRRDLGAPKLRLLGASNSQVVTSERNMTVCGGLVSSNQNTTQYQCSTYLTTQDMVARQNELDDNLSVYVVYKSFLQHSEVNPSSEFTADELKMTPMTQNDLHIILKATVSQEGRLLGLERPQGTEPSELLVRLTERLIEQYFPNLNSTLYNSTDSENFLLKSGAEGEAQSNVEDTYLGQVIPTYTISEKEDGTVELRKSYTQDNFVNYEENNLTKAPEVTYDSKFIVQDGNVKQNNEVLEFNLNKISHDEFARLKSSGNEQNNELIGSINARIESNFKLINIGYNKTLTSYIKSYEKTTQFSPINLQAPQNKLQRGSSVQSPNLLSESEAIFSKDYKIFELSILNNKFHLSVSMKTLEEQTQLNSGIYLNDASIMSFYDSTIEHKFMKCEQIDKNDSQSRQFTVFQYTHSLYGGLVKIPISVDIDIQYGWSFSQQQGEADICQLKFQPYATPTIIGTAKVNFLSIGEAGIEAKGTVANTKVKFCADIVKKELRAQVSLNIEVQPYAYQVQLFYSTVTCTSNNILWNAISLFLKFDDTCKLGDRTYYELSKGEATESSEFQIFDEQIDIKQFIKNVITPNEEEFFEEY